MKRPRGVPWFGLGLEAWSLGVEAATVVGLRSLKIAAGGPAAAEEARLMVDEKIAAAIALQAKAVSGALGHSPAGVTMSMLSHYRRRVVANRRRLQRRG